MGSERILIVDDEPVWVDLVRFWLERAGYSNLDSAHSGALAVAAAELNAPECILLDLVLPDQSGLAVCQKLRSLPKLCRTPIVLLTGHKKERLLGLQNGADYFVGKSDDPAELLTTIEAVFRRRQHEEGTLVCGPLTLKTNDRKVFWHGQCVAELSPKMFTLVHILVQRSPQPVSRLELHELVEGSSDATLSRALDVMLNRLRKALPGELSARIVNVKNFGYVFLERPINAAPTGIIP